MERKGVVLFHPDPAKAAQCPGGFQTPDFRDGLAIPTTLYNMKKTTVRHIDKAGATALKEKFGLSED